MSGKWTGVGPEGSHKKNNFKKIQLKKPVQFLPWEKDDMEEENKKLDAILTTTKAYMLVLYGNARKDAQEAIQVFLSEYEDEDKRKNEEKNNGSISDDDYIAWRLSLMNGEDYDHLVTLLVEIFVRADIVNGNYLNSLSSAAYEISYSHEQYRENLLYKGGLKNGL